MSDINPPDQPDPPELGDSAGATAKPGLMQRFRNLPLWAQVLLPALVVVVLVGGGLLIANAASSDSPSNSASPSAESTTTTTPGQADAHGPAVLLIVTQLAGESGTPPTEPSTSLEPTSSTEVPTTQSSTSSTEPSTTTPPTTTPPTTEPSTSTTASSITPPTRPTTTSSTESATTAPATTAPPTSEPSTSTTAPSTTPPTGGLPAGTVAASPEAFATAWNHSVQGTQLATLSAGPTPPPNFTQQSIGGIAAYVANLGGNVWLAALAQSPGAAIAQALLVWEPNVDSAQEEAQNALYRDAFQALMETVNSSITTAQKLKVTAQLDLTRRQPPYPDTTQKTAMQAPHQYDLFNVDPAHPTQPGAATVISVITAQG